MPPSSGSPLVDLQVEHSNLQVILERREDKIERQAKQITRLEASRKTLRKQNKELRETLGYRHCNNCNKLGTTYPYALPHTLDTIELCQSCLEEVMGMTLNEIYPDDRDYPIT